MCTVLLPPDVNPIAAYKYIDQYKKSRVPELNDSGKPMVNLLKHSGYCMYH